MATRADFEAQGRPQGQVGVMPGVPRKSLQVRCMALVLEATVPLFSDSSRKIGSKYIHTCSSFIAVLFLNFFLVIISSVQLLASLLLRSQISVTFSN